MKNCPYCAEEIRDEAVKCKHCQSWLTAPPAGQPGSAPSPFGWLSAGAKESFRRSSTDKMLSGVCAGFARYIGVDPTWVRIFYAAATIFTAGFPGVILYIILAYVVPSDDAVLR